MSVLLKVVAICTVGILALGMQSCVTAPPPNNQQGRELTSGLVKMEIRKGMSGAEVIQALGSPNTQTRDENGLETWVYDKIATQAEYNDSSSGLFLVLFGASQSQASYQQTQKTFTVVIKLDSADTVESFTYHSTKF